MLRTVLSIVLICLVVFSVCCGVKQPDNSNLAINVSPSDAVPSSPDPSERKSVDYFAHIKPEHREVLRGWLKSKPYLRPAVEEIDNSIFSEQYKPYFDENYRVLRETLGDGNYQYYSVGDMNHDKTADFAVLLVDTRQQNDGDRFALAIFNAPFKSANYFEEELHGITNSYIKFNAFDEPYLFLGKFESDYYCATYYPKGKTYYFKDCTD